MVRYDREVCVLLFFRYGITPTANKLYQLAQGQHERAGRGPGQVLGDPAREKQRAHRAPRPAAVPPRRGWRDDRHPVGQRAQASAQDALAQLRDEARASVVAADASVQAAVARAQAAEEALGGVTAELHATREKLDSTQADVARAQDEVASLQRQIDTDSAQRREIREALNAAQERFTREIEQQRAVAAATEARHDADMRRVLLDVDRERANAAKLQKELE